MKLVDVTSLVLQVLYKTMLEDSKRGIATVRSSLHLASLRCTLARCAQQLPPQSHAQPRACFVAQPVSHTWTVDGWVGAQALRVFVEAENYPILIHCIHGKDRTGAPGPGLVRVGLHSSPVVAQRQRQGC